MSTFSIQRDHPRSAARRAAQDLVILKGPNKKWLSGHQLLHNLLYLGIFLVKIMSAELRTPQQFLCSMYLKSGKAILREQKLFFFPVKKPHSEEISSGAILGTNLSFTKGGRGVSEFCAGPSNQLRANLSLQPLEKKCLRAAPAGYGA